MLFSDEVPVFSYAEKRRLHASPCLFVADFDQPERTSLVRRLQQHVRVDSTGKVLHNAEARPFIHCYHGYDCFPHSLYPTLESH